LPENPLAPLAVFAGACDAQLQRGAQARSGDRGMSRPPLTAFTGPHLEHIFEKLGVETRTAAAALAHQTLERLLPPERLAAS
jgi:hypothetical protein